ncbi:hypothetical protein BD626DRAFT_120230 [Schizophyllum amplum]|uniref:Uncharacterized protein n=1 Tax=Schizophyllum amplum TaxID=97359 RepID=A0A550CVC2_9AGAR|nr:hypothetical protein BD626DRAFT_120230 [Auriculariopsis ampla]
MSYAFVRRAEIAYNSWRRMASAWASQVVLSSCLPLSALSERSRVCDACVVAHRHGRKSLEFFLVLPGLASLVTGRTTQPTANSVIRGAAHQVRPRGLIDWCEART